jgi:hypothetical protein
VAAEDFFNRWAKRKPNQTDEPINQVQPAARPSADVVPKDSADSRVKPLPTIEDVAELKQDSDYSPFVAKGVDENVKRAAMKKLFSDPHFNVMDRLDIYIDDYSQPNPIPPAVLAALTHAKALLNPLGHFEKPVAELIDAEHEQNAGDAENVAHVAPEDQVPEDASVPTSDSTSVPVQSSAEASSSVDVDNVPDAEVPDTAHYRENSV